MVLNPHAGPLVAFTWGATMVAGLRNIAHILSFHNERC
jgi:hypothetical protein